MGRHRKHARPMTSNERAKASRLNKIQVAYEDGWNDAMSVALIAWQETLYERCNNPKKRYPAKLTKAK
jgi:hypothetical protein